MLWDVWGDGGWEYGHVFATNGWRLWGVCNTPLHVLHDIHRNTNVFSEPGTCYLSKYERVFRTGYTLRIEIRTCFPKGIHVIHQNTAVFSELGEGVDEPEDGEEDDGGAYDAVQYADTTNVEPSAEARHEVGDQQPPQDGSGGNTGQTYGHVPDAGRKDEGEPGKEADI